MHTKDFRVLASTCKSHSNREVTADVGIELHCTAILDEQTLGYDFNSWYNRQRYYVAATCVGWWDNTRGHTCNISYYDFASARVSADKDGIHCSVARIYRDIYFDYYYYRLLYDIPIKIIRKGKNNTAHAIHSCACCIDVVEAHTLLC